MKKIILGLIITMFIFSCSKEENISIKKEENKINIQTSIIPIASITNYIGGDFVEAKSIVPAGVSRHGYDLKPEQMIDIQNSDLIIYLNLEHIDSFLNKAIINKNNLVVSSKINLIKGKEHNHEEKNKEEHKEEINEKENHKIDPHVWTSPKNAILIAGEISKKLSELKPEQKAYFENNLTSFTNELNNLKNDFITKNNSKKPKEFIVFHDAYNYLFEDLKIDENKKLVFQKNILSDPNSAEMKELIDEIKLHGVNIAFREPQLNDSNLTKLSNEYSLKIEILNPLGSDTSKNGYTQNLKNNLISLEKIYE